MSKRARAKSVKENVPEEISKTTELGKFEEIDVDEPPKRRLRSNFSMGDPPAKRVRSNSTSEELKENKPKAVRKVVPFIKYQGDIKYFSKYTDIAAVSDELLQWVENHSDEIIPLSFDMEWPFNFQTGPGKSALIQICAKIDLCYLFHISQIKSLPASLVKLLTHDKVKLHGVNVKNDCRKLQRDFPEIDSQKMVDQCTDLGVWCNAVTGTGGRWSMERLVKHLCNLRINKDKSVRNSKWHIIPLNKNQQVYAAIDVYIAQVMYYDLEKRLKEKLEKEAAIVEEFGEAALKVVNSLK